jgi:spore coat polysaccharide biosynthesis protein SpsF (cytidylyltransferase family)
VEFGNCCFENLNFFKKSIRLIFFKKIDFDFLKKIYDTMYNKEENFKRFYLKSLKIIFRNHAP